MLKISRQTSCETWIHGGSPPYGGCSPWAIIMVTKITTAPGAKEGGATDGDHMGDEHLHAYCYLGAKCQPMRKATSTTNVGWKGGWWCLGAWGRSCRWLPNQGWCYRIVFVQMPTIGRLRVCCMLHHFFPMQWSLRDCILLSISSGYSHPVSDFDLQAFKI